MEIVYLLRINAPDEIDEETLVEIEDEAMPNDSQEAAVRRWLGGKIQHAEDTLNDGLPDGWNVEVQASKI